MKKVGMIITVIMLAAMMFAACSKDGDMQTNAAPTDANTDATTAETPTPSYAAEDVVGIWCVGSMLDAAGAPVSADEMQRLGAGFSMELLASGDYFVYAANGVLLGQGTYSVVGNVLILSAGGDETRYVIENTDALRTTSDDDSVTVMVRSVADIETDVPDEDTPDEFDVDE